MSLLAVSITKNVHYKLVHYPDHGYEWEGLGVFHDYVCAAPLASKDDAINDAVSSLLKLLSAEPQISEAARSQLARQPKQQQPVESRDFAVYEICGHDWHWKGKGTYEGWCNEYGCSSRQDAVADAIASLQLMDNAMCPTDCDELTALREQLAPFSYADIEALIGRADTIYDVRGYKAYLGEIWNAQDFSTEEDKGYCWNLILFCVERIQILRSAAGYGWNDIQKPIQTWP